MYKLGRFPSESWVRADCEITRRFGEESERVALATVVAPMLEQPLLANRPALTAFLKRVWTEVRLTDWVWQTAADRLELVRLCTIREQALKIPLRLAGHVDATLSPSCARRRTRRRASRLARARTPAAYVGWSRRGCRFDMYRSPSQDLAAPAIWGVGNADARGVYASRMIGQAGWQRRQLGD